MASNTYTGVVSVCPLERSVVGMVIGRGGVGIKDVIHKSGVKQVNYNRPKSQFELTGNPNQVDRAIKMIGSKIDEYMYQKERSDLYRFNTVRTTSLVSAPQRTPPVRVSRVSPLSNGFSALSQLDSRILEDALTKVNVNEAKSEAEKVTGQKENFAKKIEQAKNECASRAVQYHGCTTPYMKTKESVDVWGGFTESSKKPKKVKTNGVRGTSIASEVLPSRNVNIRELHAHNNRIFREEKAQREAKKLAWDAMVTAKAPKMKRERSPSPTPSMESIPEEGSLLRESDEVSPVSYDIPIDANYRNSQPTKRLHGEKDMGQLNSDDESNIEEYLDSLCIGYSA